jgi:hypothetical protein
VGGWPAGLSRSAAGLLNTVIFVLAALVLTGIGQAVVGRFDLAGMFSTRVSTDTHQGVFTAFPFTVPPAAAVFVVMLQLTFVCAKWPFDGLGRGPSGFAALALSWVVGTAGYFLLTNWNSVPAAARAGTDPGPGVRRPRGRERAGRCQAVPAPPDTSTAARPASRRATGTRNGEHDT